MHSAHSTRPTRALARTHPIPPRALAAAQRLSFYSNFVFRIRSKTKRGQIPHRIMADSCQFHSWRMTPFRAPFTVFGRVFVSVCLLFFACMFLNNVSTLYKNQPVSALNKSSSFVSSTCVLSQLLQTLRSSLWLTHFALNSSSHALAFRNFVLSRPSLGKAPRLYRLGQQT